MEPLPVVEGGVHPEIGGARQNAFCEREDALHVEFIELAGVTLDPRERELLAQFLGVASSTASFHHRHRCTGQSSLQCPLPEQRRELANA